MLNLKFMLAQFMLNMQSMLDIDTLFDTFYILMQ